MWQRFTERARRVVFFAQEEAGRLGGNLVSTEHLLLGLIRENDSVAARILDRIGISLVKVRSEVEWQIDKGDGRLGSDMQLTPRAKRVIDLAYDEARQLDNNYIGTEHLLLGLIREAEGLAGRVLIEMGVSLDAARAEVRLIQTENLTDKNVHASKPTERESAPVPIRPGDLGLLRMPPAPGGAEPMQTAPQPVPLLADNSEIVTLYHEIFELRDAYRFAELLRGGAMVYVASDTQAKLLRESGTASGLLYVRLQNGEREGQTFWVSRQFFHRTGVDTRPFPPPPDDLPTLDGQSVAALLADAAGRDAAALYLMSGQPPFIATGDRLTRLVDTPVTHAELTRMTTDFLSTLSSEQNSAFEESGSGAFEYVADGNRFRVTVYRDGYALGMALVRRADS